MDKSEHRIFIFQKERKPENKSYHIFSAFLSALSSLKKFPYFWDRGLEAYAGLGIQFVMSEPKNGFRLYRRKSSRNKYCAKWLKYLNFSC
jgi:hypothetical protein